MTALKRIGQYSAGAFLFGVGLGLVSVERNVGWALVIVGVAVVMGGER